jgi:hypothetical protein
VDVQGPGLEPLKGLAQLQELNLAFSGATGPGLEHLKQLRKLDFCNRGARIGPLTDGSLTHLERLTQLRELDVKGHRVTKHGVNNLQKALPSLKVED